MAMLVVMFGCFIVVGSFALGAFLGLYAGSKREWYARPLKKEKEENDSDKLTLEKQLENIMKYGGGD